MSPEEPVRSEQLNRFSRFIFSLPDDKRDFLLEFIQSEAPQLSERLGAGLPEVEELRELTTRSIQELLRSASFTTLAWALQDKPEELVVFCGENMSNRARLMLKEEIEQVHRYRRRDSEQGGIKPEKYEEVKKYKTLLFRLRLQNWREEESEEMVE